MQLRDHEPIVIDEFNGLWRRGRADSCPLDHFTDCENIAYQEKQVETRPGLETLLGPGEFSGKILRHYNYKTTTGESLLILTDEGKIYHALLDSGGTVHGPILTIATMTDFGFVSVAGRAYITPFGTFQDTNGNNYQKGLDNEFLYVYKGDGTAARKAAGSAPTNASKKPFIAYNSAVDGIISKGVHVIAVSYNGGILGPEVFPVVLAPGDKELVLNNIPIGPGGTTSRTIVMTRAIDPKDYIADQTSYTYYTALTIADNITENVSINLADSSLTVVYVPGATAAPAPAALTAANTATLGYSDFGLHIFAIVYETDTGYLTEPGPEFFAVQTTIDIKKKILIARIPTSPSSAVTKRHIVATKVIPDFNGDQIGYQFFFVPDGEIANNVDTTKEISFYDSDLLDDASHLIDNFAEIPAGVALNTYRGRLCLGATFDDISVLYLSAPGEPEAINEIDGLIIVPLDGRPITACQEFRDVLYVYKQTRTYAYVDNGDEPASWEPTILDQGIGAAVHGVCTVLDSGGVNIDFLIIANWSGIIIFNGAYVDPELSWKIETYWLELDQDEFAIIQVVNDVIGKLLYLNLPNNRILVGDYGRGLDSKNIKWVPWKFDVEVKTIALIRINQLAIGVKEISA